MLEEQTQLVDSEGNPVSTAATIGEDGQLLTPQGVDASIALSTCFTSASDVGGVESMFKWTIADLL